MRHSDPDIYEFDVAMTTPDGRRIRAAIRVDNRATGDALSPLPKDRDLPYVNLQYVQLERIRAEIAKRRRRDLASGIAKQLAAKILELIERQDPQNGYPPSEAQHCQIGS